MTLARWYTGAFKANQPTRGEDHGHPSEASLEGKA
jgi:hypothetical protein